MLDRWRDHLAGGVIPRPESDLHEDDTKWMYARTSSLAVVGLGAAREHLHAVRLLVDAKQLFPSAVSTLARAALVGAAQTVWILAPVEHPERLRRSLSVAREDYHWHIRFGEYVLSKDNVAEPTPMAPEQLDRLRLRHQQVSAMLDNLGGAIKINISDTLLPAALEATSSDPEFRAQVMMRWRSMSASAHSLLWEQFGHTGTSIHDTDSDGIGLVVVGGDVARLAMDYFSAFQVASTGWRLLAKRTGLVF